MVCVRKKGIGGTAVDLMQSERWAHDWLKWYDEGGFDGLRVLLRSGRSMQTRLGQLAAEKYGTVSAGLMREYGMHLGKTRKYIPSVVRLQAGRGSRASLQACMQGSLPPASAASWRDADGVVGCRDMQAASKHGFWARTDPIWERHDKHASAVGFGCGYSPAEGTAAQNRAETSYRQPLSQPWVAVRCPLPLKLRIRSYQPPW